METKEKFILVLHEDAYSNFYNSTTTLYDIVITLDNLTAEKGCKNFLIASSWPEVYYMVDIKLRRGHHPFPLRFNGWHARLPPIGSALSALLCFLCFILTQPPVIDWWNSYFKKGEKKRQHIEVMKNPIWDKIVGCFFEKNC